jgi:PilZ domain-containing protein
MGSQAVPELEVNMERRLLSRIPIDHETTIMTKDGNFTGVLENISMGGFFLRTNKRIEVGENVEVDIPFTSTVNIVTNVIAIRIEDDGIAFKFENIDHYNFWTLHSFINYTNA